MPPIRSVSIDATQIQILDRIGTRRLTYSSIPQSQNSIAKAEAWVNNWLAQNITEYAVVVHVFSISPLRVTVWTGAAGTSPPADWWL